MHSKHTVEKIGGTSMSRFGEVMRQVFIGNRTDEKLYNRIFIVSAYGGITNYLLENKKNGSPGVWAYFADNDPRWEEALELVREKMIDCNRSFENEGLDQIEADAFVNTRLNGIKQCIRDVMHMRSYGHFSPKHYLLPMRELLAAVGEAHSAFNSTLILRKNAINAEFFDLTGYMESEMLSFDEKIHRHFDGVDFSKVMPIVTGYVKYEEGIMTSYDRGYSEITFSKIATLTNAAEGIIHKEYHLCSGDPVLLGANNVKVIGHTNFDIADQMADMEMEAIHSKASKEMELRNIPIRIKNAFDPEHEGTLISKSYISPIPRVEMITARDDVIAVEVFDPEMVGQYGYDHHILSSLRHFSISFISVNTNANCICHYVPMKSKNLQACVEDIRQRLPYSQVRLIDVGIVSIMGSNMKSPHILAKSSTALAEKEINILGVDQCTRQVSIQFIVERQQTNEAQIALHRALIENS